MIFGGHSLGQRPVTPRVVAVVGDREIRQARNLLRLLAERLKGARLSPFERRQVERMATAVALRKKRGLTPTLSREQALVIWNAVGAGAA